MSPIVEEGLNLALLGMGTVFVFLTLLVLATTAMSALVRSTSSAQETTTHGLDGKKLAAITAAVHQHRNRR